VSVCTDGRGQCLCALMGGDGALMGGGFKVLGFREILICQPSTEHLLMTVATGLRTVLTFRTAELGIDGQWLVDKYQRQLSRAWDVHWAES
jgi:hypothetical protein